MSLEQLLTKRNATQISFTKIIYGINQHTSSNIILSYGDCNCACNCDCNCSGPGADFCACECACNCRN